MEYEKTPHNTNRLWLKRSEMPEDITKLNMMLVVMGAFSIWGSADVTAPDVMSWEFSESITKSVIVVALVRCDCKFDYE